MRLKEWEWFIIQALLVAILTSTILTVLYYWTRFQFDMVFQIAVMGAVLFYLTYDALPERIDYFRSKKEDKTIK